MPVRNECGINLFTVQAESPLPGQNEYDRFCGQREDLSRRLLSFAKLPFRCESDMKCSRYAVERRSQLACTIHFVPYSSKNYAGIV